MTLISGTHLLASSKETKTKLNTDFDIPLTEEAVKKRKEDKRLQKVSKDKKSELSVAVDSNNIQSIVMLCYISGFYQDWVLSLSMFSEMF